MECCVLDPAQWAEVNFGKCQFGDVRLTQRVVRYAASSVARPNETTPHQTRTDAACKAAYRLMDNDKVSFPELVRPHCENTRAYAQSGVWLSLCDTTEVSFSLKRKVKGLGPVGSGIGRGFFLHSSFLVASNSDEIVGLAAQELFYRKPKPPGDTSAKRKKRKRESEVWGRIVDQVGSPAPGVTLIHVCDRGADDFEFYCHCLASETGWVVRAKVLSRRVRPFDPEQPENPKAQATERLGDYVAAQEPLGTYMLELKANKSQQARTATVEVRSGSIWMPRPSSTSPWVKEHGPRFIRMDAIEVREVHTPKRCEPLRWVLLSDRRVTGFESACETIGYYEKRPLIEEYHKAAKTGCQIEERLYRTADRLERIVGILSVIAVRLVQMKTVARVEPERPAADVAPEEWIEATCDYHRNLSPKQRDKWNPETLTIRDLLRGIAMMGGFRGRKSDGEPGWIVLWRGVKELLAKLEARREMRQTCGYS